MRLAADGGAMGDPSEGWLDRLVRLVEPAIYDPSWGPWVRLMITAMVLFVLVMAWRRWWRA